jgi:hypothetical protein
MEMCLYRQATKRALADCTKPVNVMYEGAPRSDAFLWKAVS